MENLTTYIEESIIRSIENRYNTHRLLYEKQGVAGYQWNSEIDEIVSCIKKTIKENKNKLSIEFDVPYELTNLITFIKDLNIHVFAKKVIVSATSGSGSFGTNEIDKDIHFDNNRYDNAKITINCQYDTKGNLIDKTALLNIYHEINHAYDLWVDFNKGKNGDIYVKSVNKSYIQNKKYNDVLNDIIYRLLCETERHALVSSTYGELKGMNSIRTNFSKDIQHTQAYIIYKNIFDNYRGVIRSLNHTTIEELKKDFEDADIKLMHGTSNDEDFKKQLIWKTHTILKDFINHIGKTASLWYDNKEDQMKKEHKLNIRKV